MNIKERNEILKSLNEGIDMLKSEGVYDARLRYEGIIKPAWAIDLYLDDSNMYIATTFSNLDDIVEIKGLEFAKNYIGKTISDVIEINFNHKTYRYYAMTRVSRILDRLVDALHKFDSDLKATYEITLLDATIMLYDINDDIGKLYDGTQFHGSVELDDIDGLMLAVIKIFLGNIGILGGDADHLVVLEKFPCLGRARHAHPALSESQIQDLMAAALFLQDDIRSHDPDIRRTVFHIGGNIRSLGQEKAKLLLLVGKNQLAGLFVLEFFAKKSGLLKKFHGLSGQTSLGEGDCQILHTFFLKAAQNCLRGK